jgi:carbon-monoxide dehydrogenase large subunit
MAVAQDERTAAGRFIGAAVKRLEDPRLLTGNGKYVDDVVVPGVLHAAFVRSPFPRALITSVDVEAARALPGVISVMTIDDLRSIGTMAAATITPPLADRSVRFVGDPVVMVVAENRALAEDACELVTVDYEPIEPVLDLDAAIAEPKRWAGPLDDTYVVGPKAIDDPEADAVFTTAPHVVTETLSQHRYLAVPMEPRGVVAHWDPFGDGMTVWISTQGAHAARDHFAQVLGLPANRVRVQVKDVGGGFGQKIGVGREETATALASFALGRPVKWIEDRYENLLAASHARAEQATASLALADDGTFLGIRAEHVDDVGAYGNSGLGIARFLAGPYRMGKVAGSSASVKTNTSSRGAYRGPWMFETVVRETMIDVAAREMGIDPLELRRRNVLQQSDLPYPAPMGDFKNVTPAETLELAVEMLGYDEFRKEQAAAREANRYLGVGIAMFIEPSAMGFGIGQTDAVTIRIDHSGSVQVITGLNSQGHSVETTVSQVVAEHLGVDIDDIVFLNGDTSLVPVGGTTGGSRNGVFGGGAARQAALEMRDRILQIAAHRMEAAPDDLEVNLGVISVKGTPTKSMTLAETAQVAYLTPSGVPDGLPLGLEVTARFTTGGTITWSNATHVCTCEVDTTTGHVTLLRYIVAEDCGTMINPMVVEGQIAGGVVQGIGGALLEHFVYDGDGNPLTTTFLDYLLPTTTEVPRLEYGHIETASDRPGGHKGLGEGGAIGAPAAVFNAVADALAPLGVRLTRQPLTPDAIVDALAATGR